MSHTNLPTRRSVWFLECQQCTLRRRWKTYMKTLQLAQSHITRKQGHNVVVGYSVEEGDYFYRVYGTEATESAAELDYSEQEEPPF